MMKLGMASIFFGYMMLVFGYDGFYLGLMICVMCGLLFEICQINNVGCDFNVHLYGGVMLL